MAEGLGALKFATFARNTGVRHGVGLKIVGDVVLGSLHGPQMRTLLKTLRPWQRGDFLDAGGAAGRA